MSRRSVVSNRVSVDQGRGATGAQGGLAVAMNGAMRQHGGIWFGWSGDEVEQFTGQLTMARADGFTTETIDLEPHDAEEYYNGYANRTLWPLVNYRIDRTVLRWEARGVGNGCGRACQCRCMAYN